MTDLNEVKKHWKIGLAGIGGLAILTYLLFPVGDPPAVNGTIRPASAQTGQPPRRLPSQPVAAESPVRALLVSDQETTLGSQISGRVISVKVGLGQAFSRGSVLVTFDCQEQRARLQMADAELDGARQNYNAKLRLQGLEQASEIEVAQAAIAVSKSEAQKRMTIAQLQQCTVVAPFSGRAVKLHVKPFQSVTVGQPLLDIVNSGSLKVRLNVPANWLRWLKSGETFEVAVDETGNTYSARVKKLNGRIDAVSQTIELEGEFLAQAPELLPGMSGTAKFAEKP